MQAWGVGDTASLQRRSGHTGRFGRLSRSQFHQIFRVLTGQKLTIGSKDGAIGVPAQSSPVLQPLPRGQTLSQHSLSTDTLSTLSIAIGASLPRDAARRAASRSCLLKKKQLKECLKNDTCEGHSLSLTVLLTVLNDTSQGHSLSLTVLNLPDSEMVYVL